MPDPKNFDRDRCFEPVVVRFIAVIDGSSANQNYGGPDHIPANGR